MSGVILFIWASFVAENTLGWKNFATFDNGPACQEAAKTLGLKPDKFRCVSTFDGKAR